MDIMRQYFKDQNEKEFQAFKETTGIVDQVRSIINKMNFVERVAIFCAATNTYPAQGCHKNNDLVEHGTLYGLKLQKFFYRRPNTFRIVHEVWMSRKNPYEFGKNNRKILVKTQWAKFPPLI